MARHDGSVNASRFGLDVGIVGSTRGSVFFLRRRRFFFFAFALGVYSILDLAMDTATSKMSRSVMSLVSMSLLVWK